MWYAVVYIGQYGSWTKGGFDSKVDALRAALDYATGGACGTRDDLLVFAEQR